MDTFQIQACPMRFHETTPKVRLNSIEISPWGEFGGIEQLFVYMCVCAVSMSVCLCVLGYPRLHTCVGGFC
jgi:hypothetical protein